MIPEMLRKAPVARRTFLALMVPPDINDNTNSPDGQSRLMPLTPDLTAISNLISVIKSETCESVRPDD